MTLWEPGEVIVRREINWGKPAVAWPVIVVQDSTELLATFTPSQSPFSFSTEPYSPSSHRHPWWPKSSWEGHGVLMLQRPGEPYAVWHFWTGPERQFSCWYINLQDPFRRTAIGIDTEDHELDVVIEPSGRWQFKDAELLEERIEAGRYTESKGDQIRQEGGRIAAMIESGATWWDPRWAEWTPPHEWPTPVPVREGWESLEWSNGSESEQ